MRLCQAVPANASLHMPSITMVTSPSPAVAETACVVADHDGTRFKVMLQLRQVRVTLQYIAYFHVCGQAPQTFVVQQGPCPLPGFSDSV